MYSLEVVKGEAEITKRLKFPKSDKFKYRIIGMYDGDMREELKEKQRGELEWDYLFLPGDVALEKEFKNAIKKEIDEFIEKIDTDIGTMLMALEKLDGTDHHDWFKGLAVELGMEINILFNYAYEIWKKQEGVLEKLQLFKEEINKLNL